MQPIDTARAYVYLKPHLHKTVPRAFRYIVLREVRRCRLKPAFASTDQDILRLGSLTQRPCMILCGLTTCYSIESAWRQRLK